LALVAVAATSGDALAKKSNRGLPPGKVLLKKTTSASLSIEKVDRELGRVEVLVGGAARAPEARLFVFHDDRDRHFISLNVHCEAANDDDGKPLGKLRCNLDLPRAYAKANVQSLTVTLHGRDIAAPADEVKQKFADSPMPSQIPPQPTIQAPATASHPTPAAPPDGGVTQGAAISVDDWWDPPPVRDAGAR
jgi:hypothetical protein